MNQSGFWSGVCESLHEVNGSGWKETVVPEKGLWGRELFFSVFANMIRY